MPNRSQRHVYEIQGTVDGIRPGGGGGGGVGSPVLLTENLAASYTSVVGFGHSITAGSFASTTAKRFLNLFATAKGATVLNSGIGGTWLQNTPSVVSSPNPTTGNGRDRFLADTLGATTKKEVLVVQYLINEARSMGDIPAGVSAANYKNDLQECMNGWMLLGYPANKIILSNDSWVTDSRLANTVPPQTRAGYEAYVTATQEVAREYGVFFADTYNYMKNNGGDALIDGGDTPPLHPGDNGHAAIATTISAAVRTYTALNNLLMTGTAAGDLIITFDAVPGAVSYDVECSLKAMLTFANTKNVLTNSATFNSLAAGDYVCRARAVYGDGQKGSWAFRRVPVTVGSTFFVLDTFDISPDGTAITSHTAGETGHTWALQPVTPAPGTPVTIGNGRAYPTNATGAVYQASPVPVNADYEVTTWIEERSTLLTNQAGPAGRMQAAADTFYYARYTEGATPAYSLFKRVAGVATQIGANYTLTLPPQGLTKLTLRMVGTTISMLVNDNVQASGTDASISVKGKAGIRMAGVGSLETGSQITTMMAKAL
jgi:hypothetical protein